MARKAQRTFRRTARAAAIRGSASWHPPAIVARRDKAIAESLHSPDIAQKEHPGGLRVTYLGPADFRTAIITETKMFGDIIANANAKS